jgi:8-oxo-dGTP pyrophosphatase MutT (NUDIX family)
MEMPGRPKQGSVLVILYAKNDETFLVLTRRREDLNNHAGQISFPGGRREANETLQMAAFREANEEVGVSIGALALLGELTTIYIPPTDYEVHPFVAWHKGFPDFAPQDREVAEIIEVPVSHLLDPETRREETWDFQGTQVDIPLYLVGGHKVWGATAIMLSEFLDRLRAVS